MTNFGLEVKISYMEHFDKNLGAPFYATDGSSGVDIKANLSPEKNILIKPGERKMIPTGLSFSIPKGFELQIRPRSGYSFKTGLYILNSPGTIDSDYRGEVKILAGNLSKENILIEHGQRIAQGVICPIMIAKFVESSDLDETVRGKDGFGSTGIN